MLSRRDGTHTGKLQDLPPKLGEKEWEKFEFRVIFLEFFFFETSTFPKKSPISTSNLSSNCPVFLQKYLDTKKMVCHTLRAQRFQVHEFRPKFVANLDHRDNRQKEEVHTQDLNLAIF